MTCNVSELYQSKSKYILVELHKLYQFRKCLINFLDLDWDFQTGIFSKRVLL